MGSDNLVVLGVDALIILERILEELGVRM